MKSQFNKAITEYISDNKRQYAVVIAALIAGLVWGSFSAASLSGEQHRDLSSYMNNFISSYNLQHISRVSVLRSSAMGNLRIVFFLWLSGTWVPLVPFTVFQMGAKGYKMGFSTAFLVSAFKGKGLLFAIMSMLPQAVILLPALTVYAVFAIKNAFSVRRVRKNGNLAVMKKEIWIRNILFTLGMLLVVFICSLFDAYVIPPVIKPVCMYLAG